MEKNVILKLEDVSKKYRYGDQIVTALDNVNLEIKTGEIIIILGPSGAGKTTLLNVLSGLDRPSEGKIMFDGKDIAKYSESKITKFRKDNLGFIFQTYNLLEHLNVYENVMVGASLGKNKNKEHINKILKMPVHFLQESGNGFFVKRDGCVLALSEKLQDVIGNPVFVDQMRDEIKYRTMDYYQRRYRGVDTGC